MSHFGVLSHNGTGHLNPLMALSGQLLARGHRVTFFQKPELESRVRQQGLEFHPLSNLESSSRENERKNVSANSQTTITELRQNIGRIVGEVKKSLREMPAALRQSGVDVLIVDEIVLAGPTLAQMLAIPYFIISTSVPLNFGWSVSNRSSRYKPRLSPLSRLQNAFLHVSVLRLHGPVRWRLDDCRREIGLGPIRRVHEEYPALAHITQLPECLDFPRAALAPTFHYTGPFVDSAMRADVQFPWDMLDGRPLVYASLGTARALQSGIFRLVAQACDELNLQLVITLGGRSNPDSLADLPGRPVVVGDAPQLELLRGAEIVITHGGLNTVLETLREGKPILAIPIAYDQPAVADRLAWLGVAEVVPAKGVTSARILSSLQKLLANGSYRSAALILQDRIRNDNGLLRAADLIEAALPRRISLSGS